MRHMPTILRALVCALALITLPPIAGPARAGDTARAGHEVSRADLIRLLGRLHEDGAVRDDLRRLGFEGEKLDIATTHAAEMLRDPVIAGYIADRVLAVQAGRKVPVGRAQGLLWGVVDDGLAHLSPTDLRYYYQVERVVLDAMPERVCGQAVRGVLNPERMADATARAAARLNVAGLRNYYRIQTDAARLGAQRGRLSTTRKRAARAEAAIFRVLTARVVQEPDAARIMETFANLDTTSNARACRAGRLFIDAVLTLEGRELHEALIQLSLP